MDNTAASDPHFEIDDMSPEDVPAISAFVDRTLGPGYMPPEQLAADLSRATAPDADGQPVICAHVARSTEGYIGGFRIAYPPGRWSHGRGDGLTEHLWPAPLSASAYFQTIVVDPESRGHGLGQRLSLRALDALRRLGAQGVVTHSWLESPHNSSQRYLKKLGFEQVAVHPRYWMEVDYHCVRCGRPCVCTAVEMALDLRAEGGTTST
ncbi:MAG: GNAT family N-acetyltransferase [Bradymonadia bacterium]